MRARNHSASGRFTGSTPADSFGAFGEEHRRLERQKARRTMQREAFKAHGATDEQLDKAIAVLIDVAIDNLPAGMIRGLSPEEAFDVVTRGAGRFVFKPVESAPPPYMLKAIQAHVDELRTQRAPAERFGFFMAIVAGSGRAMGKSEAEIDEKLAEIREDLELRGPALEAAEQLEDRGEGQGDGSPVPEGVKGALLKLTDDDAIALVKSTADLEQLEQWLEVESLAKTTRRPVLEALEATIEKLYEGEGAGGASSPDSSSPPPAEGGQGAPSPTAPGDGAPPEAKPTPKASPSSNRRRR